MSGFEVNEPILNSPFEEPKAFWYIREGEEPERREGRRLAVIFPPRDQKEPWSEIPGVIRKSALYPVGFDLELVNDLRMRVTEWRQSNYEGVTRVTRELLQYWRREGRRHRLFFAQLEAAETIIFLKEARDDFRQGIAVARDEPSDKKREEGYTGFERLACKMATGGGKTTVMGMLAAWSILNKCEYRGNASYSDVVLIVCPNVTIRNRLQELDPELGEASLYRKRDLVPENLMPQLRKGRVLVTNWHVFQPQSPQAAGESARVIRAGKPVETNETIHIGPKNTTLRGKRYLTLETLNTQVATGMIEIKSEKRGADGSLISVKVRAIRYEESDTALIQRVLGREVGGKQNILVMNDEAHHAYRIVKEKDDDEEEDLFGEDEEAEEFYKEATVWVDGLDKIQKLRGINFCVDLSATPYYLGRVGQETNKPFPWVVSDFGLIEAIESGLVKIPQLAIRDATGAQIPAYFNIWKWIIEQKLTPAEKGGKKSSPKPEAIIKYAHTPIAMLGSLWLEEFARAKKSDDPRPPVFIIVCKNTKIAKVVYEWLAENKPPSGIPSSKIEEFRNRDGQTNTIRVDSKVVHETDTGEAKGDESRWMRLTLDTIGRTEWPADSQGRPIHPEGFEDLAKKLNRPLSPPGRDIRCIVSVGMLTEGWDCNTVSHIIGLRPFMSQLLCEQVVGRGLRRASYDLDEEKGLFTEEVSKVLGVPFEVIPYKANPQGPTKTKSDRKNVRSLPERKHLEIQFPRVEGYTQAIRNRIMMDWTSVSPLFIKPDVIPPEVEMKGLSINNQGRPSLSGPGRSDDATLKAFRSTRRIQELVFDMCRALLDRYIIQAENDLPRHVVFPQLVAIVQRYIDEKVRAIAPAEKKDLFLAPWYGWLFEILFQGIRSDTGTGDAPEIPIVEKNRPLGSTSAVDFWTSKEVREIRHSHVNYLVADTKRWEQSAAYYIDRHKDAEAFVKNAGLGFAIPYFHNGQAHDYMPDYILRLKGAQRRFLILEMKGYDPLEEVKKQAAMRWVAAVNASGKYGKWVYKIVHKPEEVSDYISEVANSNNE